MTASHRRMIIGAALLVGLLIAGGIGVRSGCGETSEPVPRAGDGGVLGAPGRGAITAAGARPLLGDGASSGMARISGTVRDVARTTVAGVELRLTGVDGEWTATTDRAGRYVIDLAGGRYQVRAVAEHAVSYERRHLAVPAGLEVEGVDFEVVRTARVSGRVVDGDGRLIGGAEIGSLTWVHGDRISGDDIPPLGGGASDDGGRFAILVPAGEVKLTASQGTLTGVTRLHWVEPGSEVSGVEIVVAAEAPRDEVLDLLDRLTVRATEDGDAGAGGGGTIAGIVRGPRGPVSVFDVQMRFADRLRFLSGDGGYRIDGVLPGEWVLSISAPGLAPAVVKVLVTPGSVVDGSVMLTAGAGIEGTITSAATGRPIAGVRVTMTTGQDSAYAHTDEAGRFVVHDIAAGRRGLEARHPGFVGKILPGLALEPGKTVRQDLVLEPIVDATGGREIELAGIGAQLGPGRGRHLVRAVLPGSPAELADVRAGDEIVDIDGRPVAGWSMYDVVEAIRGVAGTVVRLDIQRGQERLRRDVVRASIRTREW